MPPLAAMTKVTPLSASMSSKYHDTLFSAGAAIDEDPETFASTNRQQNAWFSVRLVSVADIDYVTVRNRPDTPEYQAWLSPYEIWVGHSEADWSSTATRCGSGPVSSPATAGPFSVACDGARGTYVTLKQVGKARWLQIAEITVYAVRIEMVAVPLAESISANNAPSSKAARWPLLPGQTQGVTTSPMAKTAVLNMQAPMLHSVTCRSVTIVWAVPTSNLHGLAIEPNSFRYALYYSPVTFMSAEKTWSTGLRGTRTTITGLLPGMSFSFSVAVGLDDDALGPRSSPLLVSLPSTCATPDTIQCHTGGSHETHRLGSPLVVPLACTSLILELPPLPPDHCDEDANQRLSIETRHADEGTWEVAKANVLSPSVILGDLQPFRAYEFRMVLRRPALGDRYGEPSGLVVTEDRVQNMTIRSPPAVRREERSGEELYTISWSSVDIGACRAGTRFSIEAAEVGTAATILRAGVLNWQTVSHNISTSSVALTAKSVHRACTRWCAFRVVPHGVAGWREATASSIAVDVGDESFSFRRAIVRVLLLVVSLCFCMLSLLAAQQYKESGTVELEAVKSEVNTMFMQAMLHCSEAWELARSGMVENARWLANAWLAGLDAGYHGDNTPTTQSITDEGEEGARLNPAPSANNNIDAEELGTDDFAPDVSGPELHQHVTTSARPCSCTMHACTSCSTRASAVEAGLD